ncbi:hypothetical protein [Acrocarpospora sp. B8E8]|uniref:hypothetical protein n=1 Tax=Acrocarpospora sp. B8E8 TaxID=3153572 RepID=UPI00325FC1A7
MAAGRGSGSTAALEVHRRAFVPGAADLRRLAKTRRLNRIIFPDDLDFSTLFPVGEEPEWFVDLLNSLAELGRSDVDPDRRSVLSAAVYSMASLALPSEAWWQRMAQRQGAGHSCGFVVLR